MDCHQDQPEQEVQRVPQHEALKRPSNSTSDEQLLKEVEGEEPEVIIENNFLMSEIRQ